VVKCAQDAFKKSGLLGHHLGSPGDKYEVEWDAYTRMLPGLVRRALETSRQKEEHLWTKANDRAVADMVCLKLRILLSGQHVRHSGYMPKLSGPLPLLCPALVSHFISSWLQARFTIYMVSYLTPSYMGCMLNPYIRLRTGSSLACVLMGTSSAALGPLQYSIRSQLASSIRSSTGLGMMRTLTYLRASRGLGNHFRLTKSSSVLRTAPLQRCGTVSSPTSSS
jgi:hypothetical protein